MKIHDFLSTAAAAAVLACTAGAQPLIGPAASRCNAASIDPLQAFVDNVVTPSAVTAALIHQIPDMQREILRIAGDDSNASEMAAANQSIYAAMQEPYLLGACGLFGLPELPGYVFTRTSPTFHTISDYHSWSIDPSWVGQSNSSAGVGIFLYTARFDGGPEHIGIQLNMDLSIVAGLSCTGQVGCVFTTYAPFDLIDSATGIGAVEAGDFLQATLRGDFPDANSALVWFIAHVQLPASIDDVPGPGGCDAQALANCLSAVEAAFNAATAANAATFGSQYADLSKQVADAAKSGVDHAIDGALGGGMGGALGGATGGPIGSLLGAIIGAPIGAAAGLIAWAFETDTATLNAQITACKQNAINAQCNAVRAAAAGMVECFEQHCPNDLEAARFVANAWIASQGC